MKCVVYTLVLKAGQSHYCFMINLAVFFFFFFFLLISKNLSVLQYNNFRSVISRGRYCTLQFISIPRSVTVRNTSGLLNTCIVIMSFASKTNA